MTNAKDSFFIPLLKYGVAVLAILAVIFGLCAAVGFI